MSGEYRVGPVDDPDRYVLGVAVASGAEGILYRGTITTAGGLVLDVAVKALQPRFGAKVDAWQARWSEQLELLRSLHVPGVVRVRDGFLGVLPHPEGQAPPAGRNLYLVMNWVDGQPLDEWVAGRPDRDVVESLKLLLPVGAALDVMHSGQMTGGVPVVHRDVKPANVLVAQTGTVLVDFGMTRGLSGGSLQSGVTGTPGYIAPESHAAGEYSPASDRYSLGCVAYFVLTGADPPERPDAPAMRARLDAVPGLSARPDVVETVMSMLATNPAVRPAHAANWLARVRGSSLSEPIVAGPPGDVAPPVPLAAAGRRSPSLMRRALMPALVIASMAIATLALADRPGNRTEMTAALVGRSTDSVVEVSSTVTPTSIATTVVVASPAPSTTKAPAASTTSTRPPAPTSTVAPTTTVSPPPRAVPAITTRNESYEVEVIGMYQRWSSQDLTGHIRRRDLRQVSGEGPDGYGAASSSGWRGTFGRRCLTSGGSSGNLSVPGEPLHLYAYGVVGLDAAKVELLWDTGRRVEAALGDQTIGAPVRWWIAGYETADPDQIVATDGAGASWSIGKGQLVGLFGQTGC